MGRGSCFSFFCPCGATLTYKQIPKAMPWADVLLAFQAVNHCFPSPKALPWAELLLAFQAVLPFPFRRICYPPAGSMRICYPTNKEEPTPALPKGGSLNEAPYSLTSNRLTSNGRHPPPFGRAGVGFHSPLPWRLLRRVLRIKNPDIQLRRICYPPEQFAPRGGQ